MIEGLIAPGCEISRTRSAAHIRRHRHLTPYAAIVLRGGYVEAGDRGRFRVEAGDVLFHDSFEAHQDHFAGGGADILNLELESAPECAAATLANADDVIRAARCDLREAAALLVEGIRPYRALLADWPDLLARDLREEKVASLAHWAAGKSLAASSVSRGFRRCYGLSPQRYALEQKALRAVRKVSAGRASLAAIAAESGFADQAHMTRTFRALYGSPPSACRG